MTIATPLFDARQIHAWYGKSHIVQGMNITIQDGELVALLGRNGAGKTTTMRAITGLLPRTEGTISFAGENLLGLPTYEIARRGISLVPENRGIFGTLTVDENLSLAAARRSRWQVQHVYEMFPALAGRRRTPGGKLSGGEQQMLSIGRALVTGPRLLLLDEPTEGLAPVIVQRIGELLRALKAQGMTILLVEQNFRFASTLADRHYVMEDGRVVAEIRREEMAGKMELLHEMLGV